jgi:hypothetical protein
MILKKKVIEDMRLLILHPLRVLLFYERFNNKSWTHFESKNICELNLANFQGINEIQKQTSKILFRTRSNDTK